MEINLIDASSSYSTNLVRLSISGFFCYIFAIVYNIAFVKRSVYIKHLYNISTGLFICYFNFGIYTAHSFVTCLVVWTTIKLVGPTPLMVGLNFLFSMVYLLYGYYEKSVQPNSGFTWTMPQCVLTLSLIALSFDIYDGETNRKKIKNNKLILNEDTALDQVPTLLEILSKTYFPPTFLIGPQMRFKDYLQYINLEVNNLDSCLKPSALRLAVGMLYMTIFRLGTSYWTLDYLLTTQFRSYGFFSKLSIIALVSRISLCKYVSGWLISEGACILYGASKDPSSELFNRCFNISLLHYETTPTFRGMIESFNLSTNAFAARYIFKRLKFLDSKLASQTLTLLFLAVWHGFASGYYNTFALELVIMKMESDIAIKVIKWRTKDDRINQWLNTPWIRWLTYLIMRIHVIYMFSYAFISFGLLDWQQWSQVLSQVYFIGHIIYFSWLCISIVFRF